MGQWGKEITVGKAVFLTHVETRQCFDPIRPGDPVNFIVCLNDGGDPVAAQAALADLEAKLIGQPHANVTHRPLLSQPRSPSLS